MAVKNVSSEQSVRKKTAPTSKVKEINKREPTVSSEGNITKKIGTGENAKNSFIWITLEWSFIVGGIASVGLYMRAVFCNTSNPTLVADLTSVWNIFIPLITLALGYAFGKSKDKDSN